MSPYAKIHHFDEDNKTVYDDDGDLRRGWYFQFIGDADIELTGLFGPYKTNTECEQAAIQEWQAD